MQPVYSNESFFHALLFMPFAMIQEGGLLIILGIILLSLYLILAALALMGLYWSFNYVGRSQESSQAIIVAKNCIPGGTRLMPFIVGKSTMMLPQEYGPEYHLTVKLPDGRQDVFSAGHDLFEICSVGMLCLVRYQEGRINKSINVTGLQQIHK